MTIAATGEGQLQGARLHIPNLLTPGPDRERDVSKVTQGFKGKDGVRAQAPLSQSGLA